MKPLVVLLFCLFSLAASQANSQELYRWIDETGKVHIVDEERRIPERYRNEVRSYGAKSGPGKRVPLEKREILEPTSKTSEEQEETEMPALTPEQRAARIEALHRKERELERERAHQKALQKRFKTKRSRFTLHEKRLKQLDQEVEAIRKELEAIRPKSQ